MLLMFLGSLTEKYTMLSYLISLTFWKRPESLKTLADGIIPHIDFPMHEFPFSKCQQNAAQANDISNRI